MTLGEFVEVFDTIHPLYVQCGDCGIADYYESTGELIEKNEFGCYGRTWDLDDDIIQYITLDGEGVLTIEIKEC